MLVPVPSRRAATTREGAPGPYFPKTCSSVTPPVILMPVSLEMSRSIWLRLALSAVMERFPSVEVTSARCVAGDGGVCGLGGAGGWDWLVGLFAGSCEA